mmetsp:Transcript_2428/g.6572  ORF Transcript_2428/g.6572 Transcript_2428/m.6572 type:complete len:489 (+) Transcript_2428:164-1630(+)
MTCMAVEYLMKVHEINGEGGKLDFEEFSRVLEHMTNAKYGDSANKPKLDEDEMEHLFEEADRDMSGTVDASELLVLLRNFSAHKMMDPSLRALIIEHDTDNSQSLNVVEIFKVLQDLSIWEVTPHDARFVTDEHRRQFRKRYGVDPKKTSPRFLSRAISAWYRRKLDMERVVELRKHIASLEEGNAEVEAEAEAKGGMGMCACGIDTGAVRGPEPAKDAEGGEDRTSKTTSAQAMLKKRIQDEQRMVNSLNAKWRDIVFVMDTEWQHPDAYIKKLEEEARGEGDWLLKWLDTYNKAFIDGYTAHTTQFDKVAEGSGDLDARRHGLMAGVESRIGALKRLEHLKKGAEVKKGSQTFGSMTRKGSIVTKEPVSEAEKRRQKTKQMREADIDKAIETQSQYCSSIGRPNVPDNSWDLSRVKDELETTVEMAEEMLKQSSDSWGEIRQAWWDLTDVVVRRAFWYIFHKRSRGFKLGISPFRLSHGTSRHYPF